MHCTQARRYSLHCTYHCGSVESICPIDGGWEPLGVPGRINRRLWQMQRPLGRGRGRITGASRAGVMRAARSAVDSPPSTDQEQAYHASPSLRFVCSLTVTDVLPALLVVMMQHHLQEAAGPLHPQIHLTTTATTTAGTMMLRMLPFNFHSPTTTSSTHSHPAEHAAAAEGRAAPDGRVCAAQQLNGRIAVATIECSEVGAVGWGGEGELQRSGEGAADGRPGEAGEGGVDARGCSC